MDTNSVLRRVVTLIAGLALKRSINYPFDFVLYPAMIVWLGYGIGGAVMIALSLPLNLAVIHAYDWSKTDWLLIESLKNLKGGESSGWVSTRVGALLKKSDIAAFFLLCFDDPVTVTLYLRHGAHEYNGLNIRDWSILIAATIVSNLYWILGIAVIIEGFRVLFP